ncbi:zinc-finger associated domain (zf-AD) domain-containing protein [Phthorimaea operculella]|nr:zinc-finger associated domain (zf-AD) domain-containing protein [Phthorimaea operculella]
MSSEIDNLEFGRCRCCLKEGNHKDITKPYYNEPDSNPEVYREILMECFNISLSMNVKLTNLICMSCIKQLREASTFKTMVTESEQTLLREIASNYAQMRLNPELKVDFHHNVTVELEPETNDRHFEDIVVKVEPLDFGECDDPPPPVDPEIEYSPAPGQDAANNSFWNPNNDETNDVGENEQMLEADMQNNLDNISEDMLENCEND